MIPSFYHSSILCGLFIFVSLNAASLAALDEPQPKGERDKAVESKDAAKIFSPEAWRKVQPVADKLFQEKKTDFVIETIDAPSKTEGDKLRAMKAEEREKYLLNLVTERVKAGKVRGIYILIYRSPSYLYVGTTGDADFPSSSASMIRAILLSSVRDKKFNDGLAKVLQIALDAKKLGEKK